MNRVATFILLFAILLFSGCADDKRDATTWNFIARDIQILVTDALGNNLLDPEVERNILEQPITIEYNQEIYPIIPLENPRDKVHFTPIWFGLRIGPDRDMSYVPLLLFGEFSAMDEHTAQVFTIDWGDGTKDLLSFDFNIIWLDGNNPAANYEIRLNGEPTKADRPLLVQIVKQ